MPVPRGALYPIGAAPPARAKTVALPVARVSQGRGEHADRGEGNQCSPPCAHHAPIMPRSRAYHQPPLLTARPSDSHASALARAAALVLAAGVPSSNSRADGQAAGHQADMRSQAATGLSTLCNQLRSVTTTDRRLCARGDRRSARGRYAYAEGAPGRVPERRVACDASSVPGGGQHVAEVELADAVERQAIGSQPGSPAGHFGKHSPVTDGDRRTLPPFCVVVGSALIGMDAMQIWPI
jgi:hypothetical protein